MSPRQLVLAWVDAFNRGAADELGAMYAENAVNHQVALEPIIGREQIREMFRREFFAAEMVCIVEQILEDGDWVALEWRDPTGLRGCGFVKCAGGLIVTQRGYWDKLSFHRLHGIPMNA